MQTQLPFPRERDWDLYRRRCDPPRDRWLQGLTIVESMALGASLSAMSGFQKIVWVFSSALLLISAVGYADGLIVVDNQQSDYSIVLARNAIPAESFTFMDAWHEQGLDPPRR